ncbi:acetate kinase [Andreprevotia lacus DSM 23236]|jgi:acetate kinase|uniref:Acetate kinase n=1 Tax=Andreprevotia lacus DSM 23236 TaxID=1121001 RepID=A0A1W1XT31_9NEIS|nr:acetate/propionate family kinase [Andreprevotia lacus]SMC26688.1 acetate kinase [Andreprevotia lacus DSM 23236]
MSARDKQLVLVINAGSSSIKFSLFGAQADPQLVCKGQVEGIFTEPHFCAKNEAGEKLSDTPLPPSGHKNHDAALRYILDWLRGHTDGRSLAVIGHRVVHGGSSFTQPVCVTPEVLAALDETVALAPLHAPHNIMPMRVLAELLPAVPQVACFDTAFHRTQSEAAQLYALPYDFSQQHGIRRYGFHGLSYEYIASVLPAVDASAAKGRTVVAHLGNGASMAGLLAGRCQATTMGFTALEGLMMGTRAGTFDPALVFHCLTHLEMSVEQVSDLVHKQSGLLGVSGISSDMRDLHASDNPRAALAISMFCQHVAREAASLAAAIEGLDALVFTAGIGENDAEVRRRVCQQLAWLGVALDDAANRQRSAAPHRISTADSRVRVYVIPTNEEVMIARHALATAA